MDFAYPFILWTLVFPLLASGDNAVMNIGIFIHFLKYLPPSSLFSHPHGST